jgi:hypothetical protein
LEGKEKGGEGKKRKGRKEKREWGEKDGEVEGGEKKEKWTWLLLFADAMQHTQVKIGSDKVLNPNQDNIRQCYTLRQRCNNVLHPSFNCQFIPPA